MGKVISVRIPDDKYEKMKGYLFEVNLDMIEAQRLRGNFENIHVFCENVFDFDTGISTRGKNDATKYFLIPTKLRRNVNLKKSVRCQRLETYDKYFFIYAVKKDIFGVEKPGESAFRR